MRRWLKGRAGRFVARLRAPAAARILLWILVFALLVTASALLLPSRWANAIGGAASLLLFVVTAELAVATWFYARRTAESLDVMKKQASAVELQVHAADKQRRATIRPVIVFRNDFDDREAMSRHEQALQDWESEYNEWKKGTRSGQPRLPPGEKPKPPGACLANEGNGVALRVEARAQTDEGKSLTACAASIGIRGSHFVEDWYRSLTGHRVLHFAAAYEDAEGTPYYTAARDMTSSDDCWRVGEGRLSSELAIPGAPTPQAPGTADDGRT
jgi:hypothetical protein